MQVDVKLDREMARLVEREGALANRAAGFALPVSEGGAEPPEVA